MGLFKRGSGGGDDDRERKERQAVDIERITAGGIPQTAEYRLRSLGGESGQAFTSDLSVPEFALIRRHGLEPLTQVMGTSMYHVGWQSVRSGWWGGTSQELAVLTDAYNDCRRRALGRLQQEAGLAGADAVVGVRITTARYDWGSDLVEFQAIGTAVRAPSLRTPLGAALTNLSGQDVALLLDGGYRPVGVVGATSVYYGQLYTWGQPIPTGVWGRWGNIEMEGATQTWYAARHRVLAGLEAEAAALGADGIVETDWGQDGAPLRGERPADRRHLHTPRPGHRRRRDRAEPGRHTNHRPDPLEEPSDELRPDLARRRPRGCARPPGPEQGRPLHVRPLGARVPAREAGGVRPGRPRRGELDLPHRVSAVELEPEPGDGRPHAGDVPRPRARHDPHGGGGRPARRGRHRRRAARRRPVRVGLGSGRVHRDRDGGQAPRRRAPPRARTGARSRATSPARTSGRCSRPATGPSACAWEAASTTSPTRA